MKITEQEFDEIFWGDHEDYELVERGQWVSEGKWESCENIVRQVSTGKTFAIYNMRTGSPYSDYYFEPSLNMYEVQQVKKTVLVWEAVTNPEQVAELLVHTSI